MARLTDSQISTLHTAMYNSFRGPAGVNQLKLLIEGISIRWEDYEVAGSLFWNTVFNILTKINQQDHTIDDLLDKLATSSYGTIAATVAQLRTAVPAQAFIDLLGALASAGLIIDSDPFLDREHLRNTVLPALLDERQPLRAVVIRGPRHSGKSFSLRPVRLSSRAVRYRVIPIDVVASGLTRDPLSLGRALADALRLDDVRMPQSDTGEPRLARRIVDGLCYAREYDDHQVPTVLVIDELDKDVAPGVVDLAEELALAVADGRIAQLRIVLIGFPRAPSTDFPLGRLQPDDVVQPGPEQVATYLDRVLAALGKDLEDGDFDRLVRDVFSNQSPPYSREFMLALPSKVRDVVSQIVAIGAASDQAQSNLQTGI